MRKLASMVALLAVFALQAEMASAASPEGPRLAYARLSFVPAPNVTGNLEVTDLFHADLIASDPAGQQSQVLLGSALGSTVLPGGGISWSPDGSTLALTGQTGGAVPTPSSDVYFLGGDGTGLRQITGLGDAYFPVLSPDGTTIYFTRLNPAPPPKVIHDGDAIGTEFSLPTTSIWEIHTDGSGLRRLSPKDNSTSYGAYSVSPINGDIAFGREKCGQRSCKRSAWSMSPSTGASTLLAKRAVGPVFSPDGRQVLLDSYRDRNWRKGREPSTELYVLDLATGEMRRLTHSRGNSEQLASWDPSGQRIAFSIFGPSKRRLSEINADGSCETPIVTAKKRGSFNPLIVGLAWQPGPGREAGRIAC